MFDASFIKQTVLYVAVGGVVYLVDLGSFTAVVLTWPDQHLLGNTLAKIAGALTGFILHKYLTFAGDQSDPVHKQALRYVTLLAVNIAGANFLLYIFIDILAAPTLPAKIGVDVLVIISSFFISRHLVFKKNKKQPGSEEVPQ
ncbi:GtrA family protein [Pelagibius sp. Alg239-R121]|uniref:GtrA family protein n=1 Tax=Pelagibius sp. Alg239-R121 TaxID=2993448 RepID=UPI0024A79333|nr:GtrA family protein [Pelagibius sp. Alg239-R121]